MMLINQYFNSTDDNRTTNMDDFTGIPQVCLDQ